MPTRNLRVAVTPPSGHSAIPKRASADLGFNIEMEVLPTEALFDRVLEGRGQLDLVQVEAWMVDRLDLEDLIEPIPATAIDRFTEIPQLFTDGVVNGQPVAGHGAAPWRVIFADPARRQESAWLRIVPTVCNADSLGWRADRVAAPVDSWAALIDPAHAGKVAIADMSAVSHIELSLALQARGIVAYADIGEQSPQEIRATYSAIEQLPPGHFFDAWASFESSIEGMANGPVTVQSCWPPAITELRARGIPVRYSQLKEGGRGWCGGFALLRGIGKDRRERALRYINWYLDGWAGAYLARQGYYSSTPEAARQWLDAAEWRYWYEGRAAEIPIAGPDGKIVGDVGSRREGGSFDERMGRIACWNTRMTEDALIRACWSGVRSQIKAAAVQNMPENQTPR